MLSIYLIWNQNLKNMQFLAQITWDVDPTIFKIGSFELRWYGLLFAGGFLLGYQVFAHIFSKENRPEKDLDSFLLTMILATVLGARIGHYVFYEGDQFLADPVGFIIEMLKPPYAGLASHGAGVGIVFALWFFTRKRPEYSFLWVLDRIAITVALVGCFIRFGNLMNSEILGKPTDLPWAFTFIQNFEFSKIPRHPAQLYESLSCLLLFGILFFLWRKYKEKTPEGLLSGIFFVWIFTLRFFYEFLKEDQVAFEADMALNMGQWLSIPMVLFGLGLLWYSRRSGNQLVG